VVTEKPKANGGKANTDCEHHRSNRDMRSGNISRFVAPNYPGTEGNLAGEEEKPDV
jgi:hypothetical protein